MYFDDFLLERRALPMPVINFAAAEIMLEEGGSALICVSVDDPPLVTFNVDVALSGTADPHLSSFTTQTLSFLANSAEPKCFDLQLEAANGQPDLNHTYTLELQNPTGGAVLGEATAMTVTVTDDVVLPEGCPWAGEDKTICAGECVYIGCLPLSEENGLCYRWFPDQNISSTYSPYPEVCPNTTTTYIIYITDDQGNLVGSDTVIVTVNPLPAVEITPPNPAICQQAPPPGVVAPGGRNNVCSMEPITLSTVETYPVYNWSTGATGPNITVSTPGPYRVTVTDTHGCSASKEVELAYCTEVTLEVSPTPAQLCEDTLILQANAGFVSYLWSDNSTVSSLIVTEPGTYSVTVQDAGGCFAVEEIEVPYCAATDIDMTIFNGLYDWLTRTPWSGGQPITEDREVRVGAVTVANLNNTDGDYLADGTTERIDVEDNDVRPINNSVVGRNEIDLMRLVIKKSADLTPTPANPIRLKQISGNVKLWWKPNKDSLVVMTNNANNLLEFAFDQNNDFLGDTMTVMYIEATGKSATVRDIEFQLAYKNQRDTVKATAIWAEQTKGWYARDSMPTLGNFGANENLNYFDDTLFIDRMTTRNISVDGTLYGYGPNTKGNLGTTAEGDYTPNIDKKLGGRHLVEYRVYPRGADVLADSAGLRFDVARQKRINAVIYTSGSGKPKKRDPMHPYLFPWQPTPAFTPHVQRNNEYPNDDGGSEDEDRTLPRMPDPLRDSMLLYSFDNVGHVIKERPVGPGQHSEDHVAFRMTKATFSEFIRIGFGNYPVNQSGREVQDTLWGSRASGRYEWHCTHYHRRGPEDKLVIDTDSVSYSEPWKQGGGNGTISIELITASAQTRAYVLAFNFSMQKWTIQGYDINNSQVINIISGPLQQPGNQWLISIPGQMSIAIDEGSEEFTNNSRFLFNVFRTTNSMGKKSGITPEKLDFLLNLLIF